MFPEGMLECILDLIQQDGEFVEEKGYQFPFGTGKIGILYSRRIAPTYTQRYPRLRVGYWNETAEQTIRVDMSVGRLSLSAQTHSRHLRGNGGDDIDFDIIFPDLLYFGFDHREALLLGEIFDTMNLLYTQPIIR